MILTPFDGKFHEKKYELPPRACRPLKKLKKNNVQEVVPQKVKKNNVEKVNPPIVDGFSPMPQAKSLLFCHTRGGVDGEMSRIQDMKMYK